MKQLALYIIFLPLLSSAQELTPVFEDTVNDKNVIQISSFNTYSSNKFNNDLMDKFIFGGHITPEMKDKTSGKLGGRNAIGGEVEQRIDAYLPKVNMFKKEEYGMKLSFSDNHYFSANIPTDLFNTAMYGNGPYVGDSMDFSLAGFQYQHYQKFSVGFYHQANLSSVQLSYVTGSKAARGGLNETWMYTNSGVDSVDLTSSGDLFLTDKFSPYFAFQGHGFAIDVNYNFVFQGKTKNRQVINFKINNLGIIFWNKNTNKYFINTDASYAGFDIQDFLNQDTTTTSIDWMDTLGVSQSQSNQIDVLPLELVVQKLPDNGIDAKWQPLYGMKAIMVPEYFPYLFAGVYYRPVPSFSASTRVSYGGFAGFRWGINLNYWIKDKMYIGLGSHDVLGLASKKIGFGRSVNFSMYFKI